MGMYKRTDFTANSFIFFENVILPQQPIINN